MDKVQLKADLRVKALSRREKLSELEVKDYSIEIVNKIIDTNEYKASNNILVYLPIRKEVDTAPLIKQATKDRKNIYVPKLLTQTRMEFYLFSGYHHLEKGRFGILEPQEMEPFGNVAAMMMVPLVAYNKNNQRIGYGGGYFDRYLARFKNIATIGAAFSCQYVDKDFAEENDVALDKIITEIS